MLYPQPSTTCELATNILINNLWHFINHSNRTTPWLAIIKYFAKHVNLICIQSLRYCWPVNSMILHNNNFNLWWLSDVIWWHGLGSLLAQAPSHYLKQCWLIISKLHDMHLWEISQKIPWLGCQSMKLLIKNKLSKTPFKSPRGHELTALGQK